MKADSLVIGGGVAGVQAALDLAEAGYKVVLIERKPSLGGRMAQLDKTFPTNDCSICILSPKLADVIGHSNVTVMTQTEAIALEGEAGSFTVKLLKHPRYVDIDACTNCGACVEKCPVKVPDEFDRELRERKAIYSYFLQGVPAAVTIDPEHCLKLTAGKCGLCQRICTAGAINYEDKEEYIDLEVASIVVATGLEEFDAKLLPNLGYGRVKNVVTGLDFERLLCASGPTDGHLVRLDNHEPVKRLAFIQCAGSRNTRTVAYCSTVCCMHSTKEAMLAYEHDKEVESTVFYADLRATGKGFQEYIARAKGEYNVTYMQGRVSNIQEGDDGSPIVHYEDIETGERHEMAFDMVVLAVALVPSRGTQEVAAALELELSPAGFLQTNAYDYTRTSREGIYACGFCRGAMDIPEAVACASSAAAHAAETVAE